MNNMFWDKMYRCRNGLYDLSMYGNGEIGPDEFWIDRTPSAVPKTAHHMGLCESYPMVLPVLLAD